MPFPSNATKLHLTIHSADGELRFDSAEVSLGYSLEREMCVDPQVQVLEAQRLGTGELIDPHVFKFLPRELLNAEELVSVQLYGLRFDGEAFTKHFAHLNRHCKHERKGDEQRGSRAHLDAKDSAVLNLYLSLLNHAVIRLTVKTADGIRYVPLQLSYELQSRQKCA